jgi:hypothetical protein
MSRIDVLLKTQFSSLSIEEKLEIKSLVRINLETLNFSRVARIKICHSPLFGLIRRWLTVSEENKSFFCFVPVLFWGESNWTVTGIRDRKHLSERVKKHDMKF